MRDTELRQNVMDELAFEPSVDATHIGVVAENGVVTLSGHVGSYAQKFAAERATRRVKGVHAIAEEIEVRYPSDKKTADDEIAARAASILRWNTVVPKDAIQVKVQDGWVTLMGIVEWRFQRNAAESDIRRLSGVAGVINEITIRPRVQSSDVKREIEDAFKRNAEIEAGHIRISVFDGGRIALDGRVHNWRERDAAERAAWSAPGVLSVEDRLVIA